MAELLASMPQTEFLGYKEVPYDSAKIICIVINGKIFDETSDKVSLEVVLDRTPFYGESGGQVGDTGLINTRDAELRVTDTQWVGKVLVHRAELVSGKIRKGDSVSAEVDAVQRQKTARNHTATHLLHAALRKVLGEHVIQAGSLVAPDKLRFDFSHPKALTKEEKRTVEDMVNGWVKSGFSVLVQEMPMEQAKKLGAMALFGEKYSAVVRVVSVGDDVSKELCGGTHLANIGDIGLVKIFAEGSVAAGMRRIEAVTDLKAKSFLEAEAISLAEEKERLAQRAKEKEQEAELQREKVKAAPMEANALIERKKIGTITIKNKIIPIYIDQNISNCADLRMIGDIALKQQEQNAEIILSNADGFTICMSGDAVMDVMPANKIFSIVKQEEGGNGGGGAKISQGKIQVERRVDPEVLFRKIQSSFFGAE